MESPLDLILSTICLWFSLVTLLPLISMMMSWALRPAAAAGPSHNLYLFCWCQPRPPDNTRRKTQRSPSLIFQHRATHKYLRQISFQLGPHLNSFLQLSLIGQPSKAGRVRGGGRGGNIIEDVNYIQFSKQHCTGGRQQRRGQVSARSEQPAAGGTTLGSFTRICNQPDKIYGNTVTFLSSNFI